VFQTFVRRYFSHWLVIVNVRRQTSNMRALVGLFSQQSVMIATHIRNQHELSAAMVEDCSLLLTQQSSVLHQLEITTGSGDAVKLLESSTGAPHQFC
jgi:L-lysine 2,3-aminomutase